MQKDYQLPECYVCCTYCKQLLSCFQSLTRNTAIEVASTVKALYNETESLLLGRVSLVSYYGCNIFTLMTVFYFYCIVLNVSAVLWC